MSGPIQQPLKVEESDNSVIVRPCVEISFNAADFTVAKTGNQATISIDSTGTGAALTRYMVGYGSASNLLTGSSLFTYDDTVGAEILSIKGSGTGDLLRIESTDAAAASAPDLVFYRSSASPAANDFIGRVDFRGKDSAGNDQDYGVICTQITTATSGGEDGNILFKAAVDGDTNLTQPGLSVKHASVVVNDGGITNMDFQVEGVNDIILFADSSQDNLGVGTDSPSSDVERVHIKGTGASATDPLVRLEVAEDGALSGPIIDLYRNSATPENSDNMGEIFFRGNHAATSGAASAGSETYGRIRMDAVSVVTSSENSILIFDVVMGGTLTEFMRLNASAGSGYIVFNETSKNIDVRMESDGNSEMFKLDAGLDYIGIGASPVANDGVLQVTSDEEIVMSITSTNSTGATLVMDAQGTGGDEWRLVSGADSAGIGGGNFGLYNVDAGAYIWTAGEDKVVGIGAFPGTDAERLHVKGGGLTAPMVLIESEDDPGTASSNPVLRLYNSSTPGTNLKGGEIEFSAKNDAGDAFVYGSIGMVIRDSSAAEDGSLAFNVALGGSSEEYIRLGTTSQQILLNPSGTNIDTVIRSETQKFVFISALSANTHFAIGFDGEGTSQSSGGAQFQVDEDASFLLPVAAYTANHDITAVQAHGYALQMKTGSGTGTFTLPASAEIGMQVTCVNFGAGMNVAVDASSSHKINGGGSAGNSTTATVTAAGARYDLVYIAADTWNCVAPAVVTAS